MNRNTIAYNPNEVSSEMNDREMSPYDSFFGSNSKNRTPFTPSPAPELNNEPNFLITAFPMGNSLEPVNQKTHMNSGHLPKNSKTLLAQELELEPTNAKSFIRQKAKVKPQETPNKTRQDLNRRVSLMINQNKTSLTNLIHLNTTYKEVSESQEKLNHFCSGHDII
jgi:hypothetical protein